MSRGVPQGCLLAAFLLLLAMGGTVAKGDDAGDEGPVVARVAQGALRGRRLRRPEGAALRTVYAFEGVPYARPPVGDRRFKDPEEADSWNGERNATDFGPNCIQKNSVTGNVSGSEDCLYLNIYTADPPSAWGAGERPVLVFVHGGSFTQSSGNMRVRTPDPLLRRGLVFVSFNYRLGVMGFLNTEDAQAPGNAGLKDQTMALRWVQRNIAAFGGDPSNVALMGESAGAGSVHYHLLSPLSAGLFNRAISVSGSVLPKWALQARPSATAQALRRRWAALCPAQDDVVGCLRRVDAQELVFHQYDVPLQKFQNYFGKSTFRPSVEAPGAGDAPFLSAHPLRLLQEGRFRRLPYMTGFTTGEGLLYLGFARLLRNASGNWADVEEHFEDIFRWEMPLGVPRTRQSARELRRFYLGNRTLYDANEDTDTLQRFVRMLSDVNWSEGCVQSARLMAERGGEVFVYQFSREGSFAPLKNALNVSHLAGVAHGDDMAYVFDWWRDARPVRYPPAEQRIRERQADLFANMAKTGNPTPPNSGLPQWPLFTAQKESYVDMDVELTVHDDALGERMAFWRSIMSPSPEGTAALPENAD